jgi:ATP-dependent DNA helicase RecG
MTERIFISSVQKELAEERRSIRDYTSNASVQVMLFADRLEVWNPGELPPALTIAQLRRPHASIPRNPLIAEPMFLARYAEKAGAASSI